MTMRMQQLSSFDGDVKLHVLFVMLRCNNLRWLRFGHGSLEAHQVVIGLGVAGMPPVVVAPQHYWQRKCGDQGDKQQRGEPHALGPP